MKKTRQQWLKFAKQTKNSIIFYRNNVLNIKRLLMTHPGGEQAIRNYLDKDVTKIFFNVYPHPQFCQIKLLKYKVGEVIEDFSVQLPEKKTIISKTNQQNHKQKKVGFTQEKLINIKLKLYQKQITGVSKQGNLRQKSIESKNIKISKQKYSELSIVFPDQNKEDTQNSAQINLKNQKNKAKYRRNSQSQFQIQIIDQQKPVISLRSTLHLKNAFNNR